MSGNPVTALLHAYRLVGNVQSASGVNSPILLRHTVPALYYRLLQRMIENVYEICPAVGMKGNSRSMSGKSAGER